MQSALDKQDFAAHSPPSEPGFVRQVGEAIVLLALAVTLFRTFFAEGYMISTGSMAPVYSATIDARPVPTARSSSPGERR